LTIIEVIREASAEQEIFALLTAYVEAVRYGDKFHTLPWRMRDLPLASVDNLAERVEGLREGLGATDVLTRPLIKEALDIFVVALDRLHSLEQERLCQTA